MMERPPDREKKHSKSLIRTGCFGHSAAYGAFYLRPITPAHSTLQTQMASVVTNILAGGDPAELLHDAAEYVDEIIVENDWNIE